MDEDIYFRKNTVFHINEFNQTGFDTYATKEYVDNTITFDSEKATSDWRFNDVLTEKRYVVFFRAMGHFTLSQ